MLTLEDDILGLYSRVLTPAHAPSSNTAKEQMQSMYQGFVLSFKQPWHANGATFTTYN